jgi:hypothetical protein
MAGTEFFLDVFLRRKIRNARTNSSVNIVNSRDPFPPSGEIPKSSSIVCMMTPLGIERGLETTRQTTRASSIFAYCRIKPLEVKPVHATLPIELRTFHTGRVADPFTPHN